MRSLVLLSSLLFLSYACAEKKNFAGGQGESPLPASKDVGLEEAKFDDFSSAGVTACVEGDKIIVPWSGPAKDCIDQGKTYLFDTKVCAEIKQASFACNWATLQEKLKEKSLLSETLKNESASGAKLISCGQSADGNRFAVQWVKVSSNPTLSCNGVQEGGGITTGCYTHYENGNPPPPATNDEEKRQRVYACLKEL